MMQHAAARKMNRTPDRPTTDSLQRTSVNSYPHHPLSDYVQPKLRISQPDDPLEREADRVADTLTSKTPMLSRSTTDLIQRQSDKQDSADTVTQQEDVEDDEPTMFFVSPGGENELDEQTEANGTFSRQGTGDRLSTTDQPVSQSALTPGGGDPLSAEVRTNMERHFGVDFSHIRIHANDHSDKLCNAVSARAFTYGNHIHFAHQQYRPATPEGQHLIAHELTHTIQQGATEGGTDHTTTSLHTGVSPQEIQRTIDLSIQFDSYSLTKLKGAVPISSGSSVGNILRGMEDAALAEFDSRNPVISVTTKDVWYYYWPSFYSSVRATRSWLAVQTTGRLGYYLRAADTNTFQFNYSHTATRARKGKFTSESGSTESGTQELTGGVTATLGFLELAASASETKTKEKTKSTTVESEDFYEHDYDVSLNYVSRWYNESDFTVDLGFILDSVKQIGGPHRRIGTVPIGSCTVKDDDPNPDNLTP